jgi:uncharacterized protein with von Willebrand factor type A (vWA) domain
MLSGGDDGGALSEIAMSPEKDAEELTEQVQDDEMPALKQKASKWSKERLEREKQEMIEEAAENTPRPDISETIEEQLSDLDYKPEDEITLEDMQGCLGDYVDKGYLDWKGNGVKITSKGARKLGNHLLSEIVKKLVAREMGAHNSRRRDHGTELSISTRKYEAGDEYYRLDIEGTFLNSLERNTGGKTFSIEPEDLRVFDEMHETKMCAGLIIDESGSMQGEKISAALATALALAELIRREPKDLLKVYMFSSEVRQIPYYDIANITHCMNSTDIRAALRTFRKGVLNENGDKQAYLITDAEANTEDGKSVGLEGATSGIIKEALYYRQAGITLNIIMLDENPYLKEIASDLARRNLGRVIFTSPQRLGEVIIKDFLASKEKSQLAS